MASITQAARSRVKGRRVPGNPRIIHPINQPPKLRIAQPTASKKVAPVVKKTAAPPIGGSSATGTTSTPSPVMAASTKMIADKRAGQERLHQQNLKDLMDFQKWYSAQADTAEGFMANRMDEANKASAARLNQALTMAQSLNVQPGEIIGDQANLINATRNIYGADQASDSAATNNVQQAAAGYLAGMRTTDNARMTDARNQAVQQNYGRLNELDALSLEDSYKQQQLKIDQATAEALGAKNAAEMDIARYDAETRRKKALSDSEYNSQRLAIDRAYKQGQISNAERANQLKELELGNASAASKYERNKNQAAWQSGARKLAKEVRTRWETIRGRAFNAQIPVNEQKKLVEMAKNSIMNDFPGLTVAQVTRALIAEFGAGAIKL